MPLENLEQQTRDATGAGRSRGIDEPEDSVVVGGHPAGDLDSPERIRAGGRHSRTARAPPAARPRGRSDLFPGRFVRRTCLPRHGMRELIAQRGRFLEGGGV